MGARVVPNPSPPPREPGPYPFRTEQTLDDGDTETYDGDPFSCPPPELLWRPPFDVAI